MHKMPVFVWGLVQKISQWCPLTAWLPWVLYPTDNIGNVGWRREDKYFILFKKFLIFETARSKLLLHYIIGYVACFAELQKF